MRCQDCGMDIHKQCLPIGMQLECFPNKQFVKKGESMMKQNVMFFLDCTPGCLFTYRVRGPTINMWVAFVNNTCITYAYAVGMHHHSLMLCIEYYNGNCPLPSTCRLFKARCLSVQSNLPMHGI